MKAQLIKNLIQALFTRLNYGGGGTAGRGIFRFRAGPVSKLADNFGLLFIN